MLNVNAITSTLAKMPDAALQKYAALHKEDPYIMALAVSESNRRKQMRNAAQAPQGMPEPPKVADQAVAEMAPAQQMPEDVGIAQLPAGDMNFAGGGIIAFGDGGEVERYQSAGSTNMYDRWEQLRREGLPENEGQGLTPYGRKYSNAPVKVIRPAPRETFEQERARNMATVANEGFVRTDPRYTLVFPSAAAQLAGASPTLADPPPAPPAPPAPASAARRTAPVAAAPAVAAPAAPMAAGFNMTPEGLAALRDKLAKDINVQEPENLRKAREELTAEDIRARQEVKDTLARDQAKFADAFKGREERLTKRGADIAKQREENTGLAFLNAGLAMMSTPGGLATAIGKGARVGTEQYAAGLDKLRSAQDKLDEARDRMEELKLNRDMMDAKEIREAEAGINAAKVAGKNRGVEALSKMFEVSTKRADTMFTTLAEVGLTQFKEGEATKRNAADIAGRERAARISAGTPSAQMQMAAALGGGTTPEQLAAGLLKMNEATTGKTDMRTLYATYLSGAQRNPGMDVMSYSQFVGQFAIPTSPGNNPAAAAPGTVRER